MEEERLEKIDNFILEHLDKNKKALRKLNNASVLLDKRYTVAKQLITDTLENIKNKWILELDTIFDRKLGDLKQMEKKIQDQSSQLKEASKDRSELIVEDLAKLIGKGKTSEELMLSLIYLDFVPLQIPIPMKMFGYLKSSPIEPKDLKLVKNEAVETTENFLIFVEGKTKYYPLLPSSFLAYVEHCDGVKEKGLIKDTKDGSYLISFSLQRPGKYVISVTLYDCHIQDSPTEIEVKNKQTIETKAVGNDIFQNEQRTLSKSTEEILNYRNRRLLATPIPKVNCDLRITGKEDDVCIKSGHQKKNQCKVTELKCISSNKTFQCNINEVTYSVKAQLMKVVGKHNGIDLSFPAGIAVNQRNEVIICDSVHHVVWIIKECGRPKKIIGQEYNGDVRLIYPSAVSILSDDDFAIKDNSGIHLYDRDGVYKRSMGKGILQKSFGLAITDDDKLVTLDKTWNPTLCIFTKDGQLCCRNRYEPLMNRLEESTCGSIACYQNEIVISDLSMNKIYKTTLHGDTISIFDFNGRSKGAMVEPSGITIAPDGRMLIADCKTNKIQIYSWNGDYLGIVKLSHCVLRPSGITLTKDGCLFLVSYTDHYFAKYQLEQD